MRGTGGEVVIDTAKTVLVPVEEYTPGSEENYLRFNGMALGTGEIAVASEPQEGIVAVMAVSAGVWERYKPEYERGEVVVTSPLLSVATGREQGGGGRGRTVDLLLTDRNVYIAVRERGVLKMAEALPDNSDDSLLYYMQVTGRRFKLRKFDIRVSGPRAELVADTLRLYFKNVRIIDGV